MFKNVHGFPGFSGVFLAVNTRLLSLLPQSLGMRLVQSFLFAFHVPLCCAHVTDQAEWV